jgi:hypothetical protein
MSAKKAHPFHYHTTLNLITLFDMNDTPEQSATISSLLQTEGESAPYEDRLLIERIVDTLPTSILTQDDFWEAVRSRVLKGALMISIDQDELGKLYISNITNEQANESTN